MINTVNLICLVFFSIVGSFVKLVNSFFFVESIILFQKLSNKNVDAK